MVLLEDDYTETGRLADLCRRIAAADRRDGRHEQAERWSRRAIELHAELLDDEAPELIAAS
jgi:hypothetical protein